MVGYEKICNNFFGADIQNGLIEPKRTHCMVCYLIVEHIKDAEFIEKQARQLVVAGCRQYGIYGKYSNHWYNAINLENRQMNQNSTENALGIINCNNNFTDFVNSIKTNLSVRYLVPTDFYLLYDDIDMYKDVKDNNCFRY